MGIDHSSWLRPMRDYRKIVPLSLRITRIAIPLLISAVATAISWLCNSNLDAGAILSSMLVVLSVLAGFSIMELTLLSDTSGNRFKKLNESSGIVLNGVMVTYRRVLIIHIVHLMYMELFSIMSISFMLVTIGYTETSLSYMGVALSLFLMLVVMAESLSAVSKLYHIVASTTGHDDGNGKQSS